MGRTSSRRLARIVRFWLSYWNQERLTKVRVIQGYAAALLAEQLGALNPEQKEAVSYIYRASFRVEDNWRYLAEYMRYRYLKCSSTPAPVALPAVLEELVAHYRLRQRQPDIVLQLPPAIPPVSGVDSCLRLALQACFEPGPHVDASDNQPLEVSVTLPTPTTVAIRVATSFRTSGRPLFLFGTPIAAAALIVDHLGGRLEGEQGARGLTWLCQLPTWDAGLRPGERPSSRSKYKPSAPANVKRSIGRTSAHRLARIVRCWLSYWRHEGLMWLNPSQGYAEFLLAGRLGALNPAQKEAVQAIYQVCLNIRDSWDYFATYMRYRYGHRDDHPEPVVLPAVLEEAVADYRLRQRQPDIVLQLPPAIPPVSGVDSYLREALRACFEPGPHVEASDEQPLEVSVTLPTPTTVAIRVATSFRISDDRPLFLPGTPIAAAALIVDHFGGRLEGEQDARGLTWLCQLPTWEPEPVALPAVLEELVADYRLRQRQPDIVLQLPPAIPPVSGVDSYLREALRACFVPGPHVEASDEQPLEVSVTLPTPTTVAIRVATSFRISDDRPLFLARTPIATAERSVARLGGRLEVEQSARGLTFLFQLPTWEPAPVALRTVLEEAVAHYRLHQRQPDIVLQLPPAIPLVKGTSHYLRQALRACFEPGFHVKASDNQPLEVSVTLPTPTTVAIRVATSFRISDDRPLFQSGTPIAVAEQSVALLGGRLEAEQSARGLIFLCQLPTWDADETPL